MDVLLVLVAQVTVYGQPVEVPGTAGRDAI